MSAAAAPPLAAAVVGYGFAGRVLHAALVAEAAAAGAAVRLHGVVARSAELRARARSEHAGVVVYEDVAAMLSDAEVKLVIIATPPHTHAAIATAAMQAGRHVVIDKPMCISVAECDELAATAERHGVLLTVFHNRRWDGDFLAVQRLVADGALGSVRWVEMAWHKFGLSTKLWKNETAATGGGTFLDLASHMVDQALLLFAPAAVTSVHCRLQRDLPGSDTDSHAQLTIAFADGRTAVIDTSALSLIPKPRFVLYGTHGTFVKIGLDAQEGALGRGEPAASARDDPATYGRLVVPGGSTASTVPTVPGHWAAFYPAVALAVARGPPYAPPVTVASVRRTLVVLFAALQSAAANQVVAVHDAAAV